MTGRCKATGPYTMSHIILHAYACIQRRHKDESIQHASACVCAPVDVCARPSLPTSAQATPTQVFCFFRFLDADGDGRISKNDACAALELAGMLDVVFPSSSHGKARRKPQAGAGLAMKLRAVAAFHASPPEALAALEPEVTVALEADTTPNMRRRHGRPWHPRHKGGQ